MIESKKIQKEKHRVERNAKMRDEQEQRASKLKRQFAHSDLSDEYVFL